MASQIQTYSSEVVGQRPLIATRDPGELYTNVAERQIGVIDLAGDAIDLVGIPFHSEENVYAIGDLMVQGTEIWRATQANGPGVFDSVDWSAVGGTTITVDAAAPVGPFNGQLWIDTGQADPETPVLYFWDDPNTAWVAVERLPLFRGNHDAAADYRGDDCVVYAGRVWQANGAIAPKAWDVADWTRLSEDNVYRGDFDAATDYLAEDVVYEAGALWRAPIDVAAGAWDEADWDEVAQRPAYRGDHDAAQPYLTADVVYRDLELWRCNAPIAAKAWDPADWLSLTQRSKYQGDYSAIATYLTGDVVHETGRLWRSNAGNAPEAFDPANWTVLQSTASEGDTFPVAPEDGDLHYLTTGTVGLYIYYNDGNSTQWVQTNGTGQETGTVRVFHGTGVANDPPSWRLDTRTRTLEYWGYVSVASSGEETISLPIHFAQTPHPTVGGESAATSGAPRAIHVAPSLDDLRFFPRSSVSPNVAASSAHYHVIGEWDGI